MKDSIDTNGIVIGRNTVREALKSERSVDAVYVASGAQDRKSTRLNSSHITRSRMPSSA